jgi:WD40 repeat protein
MLFAVKILDIRTPALGVVSPSVAVHSLAAAAAGGVNIVPSSSSSTLAAAASASAATAAGAASPSITLASTPSASVSGSLGANVTIADVSWNPHVSCGSWLVTAPTNSKIALYNLAKEGLKRPERTMEDHERTVNRLSWHTVEPTLLYSASQDGHVKLWDLRVPGRNCVSSFADAVSVRGMST